MHRKIIDYINNWLLTLLSDQQVCMCFIVYVTFQNFYYRAYNDKICVI